MDQLHTTIQNLEKKLLQLKENYVAQQKIIHNLQQDNNQLRNVLATQNLAKTSRSAKNIPFYKNPCKCLIIVFPRSIL